MKRRSFIKGALAAAKRKWLGWQYGWLRHQVQPKAISLKELLAIARSTNWERQEEEIKAILNKPNPLLEN